MNLMELGGTVSGIIVGIQISSIGFSHYGIMGLVIGFPLGFITGVILGVAIVFFLFFIGVVRETIMQRFKLKKRFGKYWSKRKSKEFQQLSSKIECHSQVEGEVICKFYYGVFIDIGNNFPSLLRCADMKKDISEIHKGEKILVYIKSLDCESNFMILSEIG